MVFEDFCLKQDIDFITVLNRVSFHCKCLKQGPRGVLAVYMTRGGGGFDGASYCEPKNIHEPKIYTKKIPGIKVFYPN